MPALRVEIRDGVAWVTIDHPPINLLDLALMTELFGAIEALERDDAVRVVVFQSANPDFFIAHADVALIQTLPTDAPPKSDRLGFFHAGVERLRTMPKATIAKIAGIARGGGSELALSLRHALRRARPLRARAARGRARHHPGRQRHAAPAAPRRPRARARDRPRLRRRARRRSPSAGAS